MKKLALAGLLAAVVGLPACTTFNPHRRTMTDWNMSMLRENHDPCGTLHPDTQPPHGWKGWDNVGKKGVNWVLVKPIQGVMLPISWLTDTLILNPIDGYKKAEYDTHEHKTCKADMTCVSNAQADHHSYGVIPAATPWPVSWALTAPEFLGRWIWNSTTPTDPVCPCAYEEYWRAHNESTGE